MFWTGEEGVFIVEGKITQVGGRLEKIGMMVVVVGGESTKSE